MNNIFVASISGNPLSDMYLSGDVISEAAKDPLAIGRLLIDMAFSEGKDIEGHAMYIEHKNNAKRMLDDFTSGLEDLMIGGWVRVITPPNLFCKEQPILQKMIQHNDAKDHGLYRGVQLIEFCITTGDLAPARVPKGFG